MVVENEGITALDVEQCLTQEGYSVCIAADAREGAARAHTFRPDLILMDINLNGPVDGIELARQLQKMSNVGIVYLTAHGERSIRARAETTRPLGFLLKPFEIPDLKLAIEVALCRLELRCAAKGRASPFVLDVRLLEQPPVVGPQSRCPLEQECAKSAELR
jgi:CheY-like chemotaxis protein